MSYQMITHTSELEAFCHQTLQTSEWVAVDTEFVRVDTYFPKLCLIQIQSQNGDAAIIDPLQIKELSALWQLLSAPNVLKIFHSARQDLEVLYQLAGQLPEPIFDTQIAAVFLKHGATVGLANLIKFELGITVPKDQTRTDWSQRPLSNEQLEYAFNDVFYLEQLYRKILPQLKSEQLNALQGDFQNLLDISHYQLTPHKAGDKLKAAKKLPAKGQAICYRLAEWREVYAIDHNKPKKWTLSDDDIISMAKRPPKDVKALYKIPGIKTANIKQFGEEWIALIDDVFAHPELWPKKSTKDAPPTDQEEVLISVGQLLCQQLAVTNNINVNQIANRQLILSMIRLRDRPQTFGWRYLLIELPFKNLLKNENTLAIIDEKVMIQ